MANRIAAFGAEDPDDRDASLEHWKQILRDDGIVKRTVSHRGGIAGSILQFELFGLPSIAYWYGREYRGKGIATRALAEFMDEVTVRPLNARVAKDNPGSVRVLEKCGFSLTGERRGFALARGTEVDELIFQLSGPGSL